ncbi:MAG: hypothetical protein M0P61_11120 [Ignavibacteriaceae bacterium]|jgi:hypothetical protein|nr:hypothetical protein [Ignavibacteriaceae bacterium]
MRIFSDMNQRKHFHNFLSSFILFVSTIVTLSICSTSNAQTSTVIRQPFRYEVYLQKNTFLVGEIVDIGVSIINTSNTIQTSGYVDIKMFNEADKITKGFTGRGLFSPLCKKLKPNDEAFKVIQLNVHFGVKRTAYSHDFFEKGTYIIKVYFSFLRDSKRDSTERVIKIVEPEGSEAVVYKSFVEIDEKKTLYNPEKQVVDLEKLFTAHPNSAYAPLILSKISRLYRVWLDDNSHEKEIAKKFMEDYTWTSKTFYYYETDFHKEVISNKQDRIQYLKKRLADVKNTPMQNQLERKLKEELDK